jgi:hypothetical protein
MFPYTNDHTVFFEEKLGSAGKPYEMRKCLHCKTNSHIWPFKNATTAANNHMEKMHVWNGQDG